MSRPYLLVGCAVGPGAASMLREGIPPNPRSPRLLDRVRETLRLRHYSRRTSHSLAAAGRRERYKDAARE
jgi:hypothetical protein